jgi:hypothetical protein
LRAAATPTLRAFWFWDAATPTLRVFWLRGADDHTKREVVNTSLTDAVKLS